MRNIIKLLSWNFFIILDLIQLFQQWIKFLLLFCLILIYLIFRFFCSKITFLMFDKIFQNFSIFSLDNLWTSILFLQTTAMFLIYKSFYSTNFGSFFIFINIFHYIRINSLFSMMKVLIFTYLAICSPLVYFLIGI